MCYNHLYHYFGGSFIFSKVMYQIQQPLKHNLSKCPLTERSNKIIFFFYFWPYYDFALGQTYNSLRRVTLVFFYLRYHSIFTNKFKLYILYYILILSSSQNKICELSFYCTYLLTEHRCRTLVVLKYSVLCRYVRDRPKMYAFV